MDESGNHMENIPFATSQDMEVLLVFMKTFTGTFGWSLVVRPSCSGSLLIGTALGVVQHKTGEKESCLTLF